MEMKKLDRGGDDHPKFYYIDPPLGKTVIKNMLMSQMNFPLDIKAILIYVYCIVRRKISFCKYSLCCKT